MKRILLATGVVVLAGCGGSSGGSGSTGTGPITGPVNTFGPIETRGQITGTPIVRDLSQISTVALAGVLTDATYRPQGRPDNETAITYSTASSIETILESGEPLETWQPPLANSSNYYQYPVWSPDGSRLYYTTQAGIYYTTPGNPTVATSLIAAAGIGYIVISPDGTKICYSRIPTGEMDYEVFVRDIAGGPTKRLTNNADTDLGSCWIDNEHVAVLTQTPGSEGTTVVKVSDLTSIPYNPVGELVAPLGRDQKGIYFLNAYPHDPLFGVSVSQKSTDTIFSYADYLTPGVEANYGASISPDNTRWVVSSATGGLYSTELLPKVVNTIIPKSPVTPQGVSWQPPLGVTKFVGSSSKLGSTSAGIIATRRTGPGRNGLASFVSWDAETRTTSTVSDDATDSGVGSKTYTIEADRLTAVKYANRPFFVGLNTVSASGTANGAIVSIDGKNGIVQSIVIFQETRGAKPTVKNQGAGRVIEGRLLGVWDAKGKNLAPSGASRVTLDAKGAPSLN